MVAKLVSQNGAVLGLLSMSLHVPARPLKVHAMPTIVQPFWLAAAVVVVVGGVAGMAGAQCSAVLGLVGSMCAHMPGRPP